MPWSAEKICPFCLGMFMVTTKNPQQIHCSGVCYHAHRHQRAVEAPKKPRPKKKRISTEHSRALHRIVSARYYASHKAEHAERVHRTPSATPEKTRKRVQRWRRKNPEKLRIRNRGYAQRHPENIVVAAQRRRARENAVERRDLTPQQWAEVQAAFAHCCAYCGRKMQRLTMDHVTPYIQGGSHTLWNVVPACHSCNSRKKDRAVLVPVQPLLLTCAPVLARVERSA